jgi:hypothetical protein
MLIINYDPTYGKGVADNRCDDVITSFYSKAEILALKKKDLCFQVGNKLVVFNALDRIAKKELSHTKISFRMCGSKIQHTENGELFNPPSALRRPSDKDKPKSKKKKFAVIINNNAANMDMEIGVAVPQAFPAPPQPAIPPPNW